MPTSLGMQMPQLYLRGRLCSKTMKGLNAIEIEKVNEIVNTIKNDPLLQPTRIEFKNALKRTIKGDYRLEESTEQEFNIAIWRASVAILYGWGKHPPIPNILKDQKQRKKFFQSWVFNYLKQIITENKRPTMTSSKIEEMPLHNIYVDEIKKIISDFKIEDSEEETKIIINLYLLPQKIIMSLNSITRRYSKYEAIYINDNEIIVNKSKLKEKDTTTIKTKCLIGTNSINNDKEENEQNIELEAPINEFEDFDSIKKLHESLSEISKKVLSIIVNPPPTYKERFGDKTTKKNIARFLKLTNGQIKEIWQELRMSYLTTIGDPY